MPRPASGAPPGRPPRTSRADVLAAASELIDRDGWQNLTIRRLASQIGTSPATVYYHVRDKDDLLIQLLNGYAEQLPRPEFPDAPRQRVISTAIFIHDVLAARPWIAEILTADDLLGVSALWMVETIVAAAIECGCEPEQAALLYRHIWYYTVGEILVRASRSRRQTQRQQRSYRDEVFEGLDPTEFPRLSALSGQWPTLTGKDTYSDGLRALVDGLLPPPGQQPHAVTQ
jgi:AcrR family transcriptional regulator